MAKCPPYHTILPEYGPKERNVYHDHDDCADGMRIKREHRVPGPGGANRFRCDNCKRLG